MKKFLGGVERRWLWKKAKSYNTFRLEMKTAVKRVVDNIVLSMSEEAILKSALSDGIYVYTIDWEENEKGYWKVLEKQIADKFAGKNVDALELYEGWKEDFFEELYSEEYVEKILNHCYQINYTDGISKLKDADMETYHVKDGERKTLAQPSDFQRCIYFYGPCIIIGPLVADEHTIESFLQARLNAKGYKVKCVNYGCWTDRGTQLNRMVSSEFHKGDIIIFYLHNGTYAGIPSINLIDICQKHQVPATWMTNLPQHSNHKLNSIYADEIFERIEPLIQEEAVDRKRVELKRDFITLGYLENYFHGFAKTHNGVNGAIVMNCNPFTYGHRYLIEQALGRGIDHLIIFVVEENLSVFTFEERFAMVVEGTKDLENVTVAPSGNFILSQTTFPEYFLKIEDEDIIHNVEYDITLFAEQIAPKLNIQWRFVGEEPEDSVTNEYNRAMKRILPKYGINIVEIPRIKNKEKVISASTVRKKLQDKESNNLNELIPPTTSKILNVCL